jgi:hypothetical protein
MDPVVTLISLGFLIVCLSILSPTFYYSFLAVAVCPFVICGDILYWIIFGKKNFTDERR